MHKKAKAGKKAVLETPLAVKVEIPQEFTELWTPDLKAAWEKLNDRQKLFLKTWYTNGFHGTKAYQAAYLCADEHGARVNASRLLANDNIYLFRQAIQNTLRPPLERIQEVYVEALEAETPIFSDGDHIMDIPNHGARMTAAEKLLKMHNLDKPAESTVNVKVSGSITIDTAQVADILNGRDPQ